MVAAFDVSKAVLDKSVGQVVERIHNRPSSIEECLGSLEPGSVVAMESTGTCHKELARRALARGFNVYVVNPRRLAAYRKSEGVRGKTDRLDAQLLELYVSEKKDRLHPYTEPSEFCSRLRELAVRRETLTRAKVQALASLEGVAALASERKRIQAAFKASLESLDRKIAKELRGSEDAERLMKVPGFGALTSAGLLSLLERYEFVSADAFVAYLGLDPRPNDSGKRRGTRFLSCEGDATVRRLLFNAAMSGASCPAWKAYYQKQLAKGLTGTEAILILARKMARTAWSMHKNHLDFSPERIDKQP